MSHEEASPASALAPRGEGIDFATWAALSARLLKLDQEERFDLLEEREIDPAEYTRAEARWVQALSDDLSEERMDRVDLYAACCAAEMQRRAALKQEPSPEPPAAPAPRPLPPPVVAEPALRTPLPPAEISSPLPPPPSTPPPPPPPPAPAVYVAAPALHVSAPAAVRAPSPFAGTMMTSEPLPGVRPAPSALPFGKAPSVEFLAEMARPSAPEAAVGGATLPLGVDLLGKMRQELPFLKASPPAAAPAATWPQLTLDTYASLCAELSVFPERALDILKKYGIADDAARRHIDREWASRLSAHPQTQELWQRKVGEFRAWLQRGGR